MADELWIDVLPSMRKFGTNLVKDATAAATRAGREAGKGYSDAFKKGSGTAAQDEVKKLESAQKQAAGLVSKLAGDVSKARQTQQRSAAALIDAEQKLIQAREKYGADSEQAKAAELRLAAAREKSEQATDRYENTVKGLKEAQKANQATTEALEKAQEDLAAEVKRQPTLWDKLKSRMKDTGGAADHARKRWQQLGKAAKTAGKWVGIGAAAIGGSLAAVAGVALKGGWDRAMNIEDARASLTGLGHDTKSVEGIMESALASVKGTAYGLGDAATIASTAVAAGIKPGQELTDKLKLTANAAAVARVDLNEMGSILNKVWTSGRVQTQELNQIADRGIPIWTKLADKYGVSADEFRKMVSKGQVDAETFAEVLTDTVGSAADEMGKTTRGQWQNMMAALSRGGEAFLKGVIPHFKSGMKTVTEWLDKIAPFAEAAGKKFGEFASGLIEGVKGVIKLLATGDFTESIFGFEEDSDFIYYLLKVRDGAIKAWEVLTQKIIPALKNFGQWVVDNKDWLTTLAVAIGAGVLAFELWTQAILAWQTAKKAATAIQTAFNAVMSANPIMLVVIAIAALTAGLVWFFTKTETGKKIWEKVTAAMKAGWDWFTAAIKAGWENYIKPAWDAMVAAFSWAWDNIIKPLWDAMAAGAAFLWEKVLRPVFNWIGEAWTNWTRNAYNAWTTILKPVWEAVKAVAVALWTRHLQPAFAAIRAGWGAVTRGIRAFWENTLRPAWLAVQQFVISLWVKHIKPKFDAIRLGWAVMVRAIRAFWQDVLRPTFTAVATKVKDLYEKGIRPPLKWIQDRWDDMVRGIRRLWNSIGKPLIDTIMKLIKGDFPAAFRSAKKTIDGIWKSIAGIARKPINFVIKTVYNDGLKSLFNGIAEKLGFSWRLPNVKPIPAYAKGGRHPGGYAIVGEEGPELIRTDGPAYVYTAAETAAFRSGKAQAPFDSLGILAGKTPADAMVPAGPDFWGNVLGGAKKMASDAWEGVKTIGNAAKELVVGAIGEAVKAMTAPLKGAISAALPGPGLNELIRGSAHKLIDRMTSWAVKQDEKKAAQQAAAGVTQVYKGELGRFHRPSKGPFTSMYGPRWGGWHAGVDIAGGGPTYSALDGIVQKTGWNLVTGRTGIGILINHGPGLWTYYGHNPVGGVKVKPGQKVKGGQHIGYQGATGNVTGTHLHFEVHRGGVGRDVNPMKYMKYDSGGVVRPGYTPVINQTGKPEALLTNGQWAVMAQLAAAGAGAGGGDVHVTISVEDLEGIKTIEEFIAMARRRGRQKQGAGAR